MAVASVPKVSTKIASVRRTNFYITCHTFFTRKGPFCIPYSQKYWRELNLAVEPKIAIHIILYYEWEILADF